jgi:hypothetical protein
VHVNFPLVTKVLIYTHVTLITIFLFGKFSLNSPVRDLKINFINSKLDLNVLMF